MMGIKVLQIGIPATTRSVSTLLEMNSTQSAIRFKELCQKERTIREPTGMQSAKKTKNCTNIESDAVQN